jgi:hypothetical protein
VYAGIVARCEDPAAFDPEEADDEELDELEDARDFMTVADASAIGSVRWRLCSVLPVTTGAISGAAFGLGGG